MNTPNPAPEPSLRELFLKALEITDSTDRARFLDEIQAKDPGLWVEVTALLKQHKEDDFLEPKKSSAHDPNAETTVDGRHAEGGASSQRLRYFGDYELLEEIARGGMGVVYKARQSSLKRTVAVKMILKGQMANADDVKRFHTEAEAAANLQHPNIVAIHEVGEQDGNHYFSMDFVEGQDLAQIVENGPMPAAKAARYVKIIAAAIQFAHQRGILHRDLKPHNVLIDAHDQPQITDFGLAKLGKEESSMTREGAVMGSPSYMPPEQAQGRLAEIGPRSDVYSVGAILYELLTGKAPFYGKTPLWTLREVLENDPVPPSKLNPKIPADLETICLKCLEKSPDRRYQSARELGEELERFLNHEPIFARPASAARKGASWCRQHPWLITAVAAVAGLGLAGLAFGLFQENRVLQWQQAHPGAELPDSDPMAIAAMMMLLSLFLAPVAGKLYWNAQHGKSLRLVGITGGLVALLALGFDMELIRRAVWSPSRPGSAISGLIYSFGMCWSGLVLVWQSARRQQIFVYEEGAQGKQKYKLELNLFVLVIGCVVFDWLAYQLGRLIVEWVQFPSSTGYLKNGRYVFGPSEQRMLNEFLEKTFPLLATSLGAAFYIAVTALRSPRGGFWRETAPLMIAVWLSTVSLTLDAMPMGLVATAAAVGLIFGVTMVTITNLRLVEVPAITVKFDLNQKAIARVLPYIVFGLPIICILLWPSNFTERLWFGLGAGLILSAFGLAVGVIAALLASAGAKGWSLIFALAVYISYLGWHAHSEGFVWLPTWEVVVLGFGSAAAIFIAARRPINPPSMNPTTQTGAPHG